MRVFTQLRWIMGCLLAVQAAVVSAGASGADSYHINPGDILQVFVWNEKDLSREAIAVQPDGRLNYPLVGEVQAGGKTSSEVSDAIAEGLKRYIQDKPVVTVSVLKVEGNLVYVMGKVNRPGVYPMSGPVDVIQVLGMAGGLTPYASEGNIKILRRDAKGQQQAIPFNYADVKAGKELDTNVLIKARDVVVVP